MKALNDINTKIGTTSVIIQVNYTWVDPRVAEACAADPKFRLQADLWKPGVDIVNAIDQEAAFVDSVPRVRILNKETGKLKMYMPFTGAVDNPMDLIDFP